MNLLAFGNFNNSDFIHVEFDTFRKQSGLNSFNLTSKKWIEATGVIWMISKSGLNIRDFASNNELVDLSNLENLNSILIRNLIDMEERYRQLKEIVIIQLKTLDGRDFMKTLKKVSNDVYNKHSNKNKI